MIDLYRLLLALLLISLHCCLGSSTGFTDAAPHCPRPSLAQAFLPSPGDQAVIGELVNTVSLVPRVMELNENYTTTLEQTLSSIWSNAVPKDEPSVMLLFYASWCPFSKLIRPVFDTLSSLYPSVYHIAVEESNVRPSVLFKYGVNSFPTLVHLTSNTRTRFHGTKNLNNLLRFYKDMTGLDPEVDGSSAALTLQSGQGRASAGICPYPQAISPEKLLQDDMYLALAACFLALRLTYLLLPVAAKSFKWWWEKLVAIFSISFSLGSPLSPRSDSSRNDDAATAPAAAAAAAAAAPAAAAATYRRINRRLQESSSRASSSSSTSFTPVPVGFTARGKSQHLYE